MMYPGADVPIAHGIPKERGILIPRANSSEAEHFCVAHQPGLVYELFIRVRNQIGTHTDSKNLEGFTAL